MIINFQQKKNNLFSSFFTHGHRISFVLGNPIFILYQIEQKKILQI